MEKKYWIHALTPIHVGAGRGLGYIDMPVVREKVTNWPYIPGSSIKGVIAEHFGATDKARKEENNKGLKAAFGISGEDINSSAGALIFTDAYIMCLPVRSFYGTFAWITSPFCLRRAGFNINFPDEISAFVTENTVLSKEENTIYLEDLDISAHKNNNADKIAEKISHSVFFNDSEWQKIFCERFAIISDDIFTFLSETGTEVSAHIRIDENTGIVKDGALWYEESLPVETILTGKIQCSKVFVKGLTDKDILDRFCKETLNIQLGGKASTGKGQVRCIFE